MVVLNLKTKLHETLHTVDLKTLTSVFLLYNVPSVLVLENYIVKESSHLMYVQDMLKLCISKNFEKMLVCRVGELLSNYSVIYGFYLVPRVVQVRYVSSSCQAGWQHTRTHLSAAGKRLRS